MYIVFLWVINNLKMDFLFFVVMFLIGFLVGLLVWDVV